MPRQPALIPSFALYGEGARGIGPGFVHIETIAARSALHDWEIEPHRHEQFVQVLLVETGRARVSFDGHEQALDAPGAVVVPPGLVHGFRFEPGTVGHVLTLSADFAGRAGGADDPLRGLLTGGGLVRLDADDAAAVGGLADTMLALSGRQPGAAALHAALAEAVARLLAQSAQASGESGADPRLARFGTLVERHFREHRDLDFYAAALGLTRRTLTRLTTAHLGRSPKQVIDGRLALEARRLLHYTNASAAGIASELGFADPSWFSRFYLRMTGRRPGAERR